MGTNLYSFQSLQCTDAGAPRAVPASFAGAVQNGNGFINRDSLGGVQPGLINVVNNFQWTSSPPGRSSRQEVPRIELREKRLKTNAIIAAAAYYLMSASASAGRFGNRIGDALGRTALGQAFGSIFNTAFNAANQFSGNLGVGAQRGFENSIINSASRIFTGKDLTTVLSSRIEGLNDKYLMPYEGLYITEDTKFKYILPYFSDLQNAVQNSFDVNDKMLGPTSILGGAINKLRSATESLARLASYTEPGLYIERPKFYQFQESGDTVQFTFPLINTGWSTYDDVKLNWQLLFLLTYQNRPNRKTREIIDPSVIYEVLIPGVKYIPFAYIKTLKIDYLGARRQMDIEVPTDAGIKTISTIVPDAYIVSITLEGLVADTQNFLMAMLGSRQDLVSIQQFDTFNPFTESIGLFEANLAGGSF